MSGEDSGATPWDYSDTDLARVDINQNEAVDAEDIREANYTPEAMTEFIRDMIANFNGIYHVVSYGEM